MAVELGWVREGNGDASNVAFAGSACVNGAFGGRDCACSGLCADARFDGKGRRCAFLSGDVDFGGGESATVDLRQ